MKASPLSLATIAVLSLMILTSCGNSSTQKAPPTTIKVNSVTNSVSRTATYMTDNDRIQAQVVFNISIGSGNTITALDTALVSGGPEISQYISLFNQNTKSTIVGKKISELSGLSAVGGASDTTMAFRQVIAGF